VSKDNISIITELVRSLGCWRGNCTNYL